MRLIQDKIEGDVTITEDTELTGMVVGAVTITKNFKLIQRGMVVGNVVLRTGASASVHGMVNGDIINDGGLLEVFGMVNGKVNRLGGKTFIDPNAKIRDGVF